MNPLRLVSQKNDCINYGVDVAVSTLNQQVSMDQFLHFKYTIPTFFWIDWNTPCEQWVAQWLLEKPLNVSFEGKIMWKDYGEMITVCCPCHEEQETCLDRSKLGSFSTSDLPLLKSLLQKCVRRGLVDQALQTALQILLIDPQTLLRRLCVIMIEDVILHVSFNTLMWLIASYSKGYKLTSSHIQWILGLVKYMCLEKKTHIVRFDPRDKQPSDRQIIRNLVKNRSVKNDLLFTVMFRVAYGGMKVDSEMFRQCVLDQINLNNLIESEPFQLIKPKTIGTLQRDQILLNSVDFHCYRQILNKLHQIFPQYSIGDLQECLWDCNSKTNYRKDVEIDHNILNMWHQIEHDTRQLQRLFLTHNG
jgi:hypothetical protein